MLRPLIPFLIKYALLYLAREDSLHTAFLKLVSVALPQNSSSDVYIVAVVEHAPHLWRSHLLTWPASISLHVLGVVVLGIVC